MKILNKEVYALMQRVGNNFPIEEIEKLKDVNVEAYNLLIQKYDPNYNYFDEKNKLDFIMKKYYEHQMKMETVIPEAILNLYNLHDCKFISAFIHNNSLRVSLDCKSGFCDVETIDFINVNSTNVEKIKGELWILYVELYKADNLFDFEILVQDEKGNLFEMYINCEEILIS